MKKRLIGVAAAVAMFAAGGVVQAQDTIKIGLTSPLTGPVAGTYAPVVDGLRIYIDRVNAAGGIDGKQIELTIRDDRGESPRAATNATRFLNDGVVLMINSSLSSTYAPVIQSGKRADVPILFAAAACPSEVFPPADPNLFCTTAFGTRYDSQAALGFIQKEAGTDVKIGFQAMGIPVSRSEIDYAEGLAKERGMTPVAKAITPPTAPSYSSFATTIKEGGAQWVWSWAPWDAQINTFEALRRLGWDGKYVAWAHVEAEAALERIKDPNLYVVGANALFFDGPPVTQEIDAAAKAAKSDYPASQMTGGWIAGMVIEAALKQAKDPTSAKSVRESMSHLKVDTKGLRGGPLEWTPENHFRTTQYYRVYHWNTQTNKIETVSDWTKFDVK